MATIMTLDERDRTIMELSGRLGFLQSELQQRDETIRALSAPKEEPDSSTTVVQSLPAAPPPPPPRQPWYQRLLFG